MSTKSAREEAFLDTLTRYRQKEDSPKTMKTQDVVAEVAVAYIACTTLTYPSSPHSVRQHSAPDGGRPPLLILCFAGPVPSPQMIKR